jgi:hypothetical protein
VSGLDDAAGGVPVDGETSWVDLATVVTAFFSTSTAVVALVVAMRSDRRSREALKVQTYLQLRAGFLDIYRQLGKLDDAADEGIEVKLTRQAYWHHAWDEFYVARRLAPREFSILWDDFFRLAVKSGLGHAALMNTLDELAREKDVGFGAYAQELVAEVKAMEQELQGTRAAGPG